MASLSDRDLLFVVESERAMERYLRENCQNPRDVDYRIWTIHFRATKKKQMGVLNSYFDALLARSKIQYNYLPHEMVVANLYKQLRIPFKWNVRCDSVKLDIAKNKYRSLDKFQKRYNHFPRSYAAVYAKLGPYAFDENTLQPIVKYSEFKKRQQDELCLSPSDEPDPVATSTPKRKSMPRSRSVQPFSDIANLFSSKDHGRTTSQRPAPTNLSRTSKPSAVAKARNNPVPRNRKTRESARRTKRVNETGESSAFTATATNEHRAVETREPAPARRNKTTASKSPIVANKRKTVRRSLTKESEKCESPNEVNEQVHPSETDRVTSGDTIEENFPVDEDTSLLECIENIERELESTSSSSNRRRMCTRAQRKSLNTSTPSDVTDLLRILEGASDESGSISTSERSIRRANTSTLDAFRPPLPVLITRRRQSTAATEIIGEDAADKDRAMELTQRVPANNELVDEDVEGSNDKFYEKFTSAEESLHSTPAPIMEQTVPIFPPEEPVGGCIDKNLKTIETTLDIGEIIRELESSVNDMEMAAAVKSAEERQSSNVVEDPSAIEEEESRDRTVDSSTGEANKEESVVSRKPSADGSLSGRVSRAEQSTLKIGKSRQSLIVDFMPKVKTISTDVPPESLDSGSVSERILRSNWKESEVLSSRTPSPEFPTRRITRSRSSASPIGHRSPSPILGRKSFVDYSSLPMSRKSDRSVSRKSPLSDRSSSPIRSRKSFVDNSSLPMSRKSDRSAPRKSSVSERSSSPILGRKSFVNDSNPPVGGKSNSSQTVCKPITRSTRCERNSLLPANISSQLNTIGEDDEDSVFREPISQSVSQPSAPRRTRRTTKPKAQNEKKLRSIIEHVDRVAKKATDTMTEEEENVFVDSPESALSQSIAYRTVRKLFTDDAVLKATQRRTRKSKNGLTSLLPAYCSESESSLSDLSSLTDRSYAGSSSAPSPLFDSIADQMDSMSLRTAKASAADAKTKAEKKTSTSTSPSLFNVGSERSSSGPKNKSLSSRSSAGSYLASQVSISSFHADDERLVSEVSSHHSGTAQVRKILRASDESSAELQLQPNRKSRTRILRSSSSSSNSAESTRSGANESHRVDASPKIRQSPKAVVADDSKMEADSSSPRSDEYAKAVVEKYFVQRSPSSESSSSKSFKYPTTMGGCRLFFDDESLPGSSLLDRKIEQYLADTGNYGSMMEIDDDPSELRSPPNDGVNEGSEFVHSPKTSRSLSKSCTSTNLESNSSVSPNINVGKRDLRSEDDDSLERLRNADKFTSPTEEDGGPAIPVPTSSRTTFEGFLQPHNSRVETSPESCLQTSKSSPTSTTHSKKSPSSTSTAMRKMNSNSPVFGSSTNTKAGKRRYIEEYSDCTPKVSSSSAEQQARPSHSGLRSAGKITKKRQKRNSTVRQRSPSDRNSSSEDEERLPPSSAIVSIAKRIVTTPILRKNSEKAVSVATIDECDTTSVVKSQTSKKSDGSRSQTDDLYKRFHFSTDEEDYNSDELSILIEKSLKKRTQFRKTSQQKMVAEFVEKDFTTELLELLDRAESRRRKVIGGSVSEPKSSSLDPTSSQGSNLDVLESLDRAESCRRKATRDSVSALVYSSLDPISSRGSSLDALREAQWNAMPSSAESAATTAEEKLQKLRESCWKESYENYTNSLNLSQYLESQPTSQKNTNYMSDDDFL